MSPAEMARTVAALVDEPTDAGNLIDAARMAADLLLELAPLTARAELDEAAVRRANLAADVAEAAKGLR
jgi:hypothetical protein